MIEDRERAEDGRLMQVPAALLLGPERKAARPPIEVVNRIEIQAPVEKVWGLLTNVGAWPGWYRACQWVRVESAGPLTFRWKAHPVELLSTVTAWERPHSFAFVADGWGVHAVRAFTIGPAADGRDTVVVSHETQVGPMPWVGRVVLGPRLRGTNQAFFEDLARAAG